jgi:hypothetical protein
MKRQAGVAMVTVLFIGAAMTAVASGAAFVTIRELNSGNQDQRATSAVSVAEAGIDRFIQEIQSGVYSFSDMNKAGCANPKLTLTNGSVGSGIYAVEMTVYDPTQSNPANRIPPATSPTTVAPCLNRPTVARDFKPYFQITSTGTFQNSTRKIRQVILLEPRNLPIGLFGNVFDANGDADLAGISLIARTNVDDRGKLDFSGTDKWYQIQDFFPGGVTGANLTDHIPTAAHSAGQLTVKNAAEYASERPNCTANKTNGNKQSIWDSDGSTGSGAITAAMVAAASGCAGLTAYPNNNKFTAADLDARFKTTLGTDDHAALKAAAKQTGIYCSYPGTGGSGAISCFVGGVAKAAGADFTATDVTNLIASGRRNFIAYFEYRSQQAGNPNSFVWNGGDVWPCSDTAANHRSVVIIVKNGSFGDINGNSRINGAIITDGDFGKGNGQAVINGTVMAQGLTIRGTINFTLDDCWIRNMPGPFFNVIRGQWTEIDR